MSSSSSSRALSTTTTRGCPPCASSRARGPRRTPAARAAGGGEHPGCLLCSSVVASTPGAMLGEVQEAVAKGAQAVELRLDFLFAGADGAVSQSMLDALVADAVPPLAAACRAGGAVSVATLRPRWEGGEYPSDSPSGSDDGERLRVGALRALAERTEVDFIDCEMLAAGSLFAPPRGGGGPWRVPAATRLILSRHDFARTPGEEELRGWQARMFELGADVAKIACRANDIVDCARTLALLGAGRTIALSMGEEGVITRLLAPKFGGFLTFGALDAARASAPGQPTLERMRGLYRLPAQGAATEVFGIVGNPVGHSKSPLLHNTAFAHAGVDAVYVPLLVHDVRAFAAAFPAAFAGFSVTIPHKEAALAVCDEVDPVAAEIGAVNTIVRRAGRLVGYNTDWSAAIGAIRRALRDARGDGSLEGKRVGVVGAGGAGRGLAFGAARRCGARVIVANRSLERARLLAEAVGGEAVAMEEVARGDVAGDVLVNTTSLGMEPDVDATPVPREALGAYELVFDAVYNPMETRLLREAAEAGCVTVSGVEMFIGQAAEQFELFTGRPTPEGVIREAVLEGLRA